MNDFLTKCAKIKRDVRSKRISSYDRSGGNNDFVVVGAGDTYTLADIPGSGIIKHIWITMSSEDEFARRNVVIRMYWDGEECPSVECPLGDFFGQGWSERYNFVSLPLAAAPAGGNALNSYFAMPFASGARIDISNESEHPIAHFYFYVDYEEHTAGLAGEYGRFHAWWNRQMPGPEWGDCDRENEWETLGPQPVNPSDRRNHLFAETTGTGHFVGVNYYVDNPTPLWYGEGDDMFLIDGEPWPGSLHGTGTEDYFNSSWCPKEIYNHPFFGYGRVNGETGWLGRTHCYRFHLTDPIYFQKSLRASIEHGHANSLTLDIATVAYWYQTEPHMKFAPMLEATKRRPMPVITPADIHRWRDAWRRDLGGGILWGNEPLPESSRIR